MPPSQYDNLMRELGALRQEIHDVREAVRDNEVNIQHALHGGNGDGPGIYERLRDLDKTILNRFKNIFDWREEHISSHEHAGQERRSSATDWRKFWMGVADRTFTVLFAIIGIVIVYLVTGHVVTFP